MAQAYYQNVWSAPEKRRVLEWLIGTIEEAITAYELDSLKVLREELMREVAHGSETLTEAQVAFKSAEAQETKKPSTSVESHAA